MFYQHKKFLVEKKQNYASFELKFRTKKKNSYTYANNLCL